MKAHNTYINKFRDKKAELRLYGVNGDLCNGVFRIPRFGCGSKWRGEIMKDLGVWQQVMIVLWALYLLAALVMDGKPKVYEDGAPFRWSFVEALANVAVEFIILWFGGFFK